MTEDEKQQFEVRVDSFIESVNQMVLKGQELSNPATAAGEKTIAPMPSEELDKHNDFMSQYIRDQFNYNYTSTVIEVKIPALVMKPDILDDDNEYQAIV